MDYKEYLEKTYAAWLGKLIGIRLGAPVENWTCEEIRKVYGKVNGYLVDYGTFASDDDANGPLFFVRALERCCSKEISAEMMGNNVLNWLCDGHGFFWWGGDGIATEHTAYNNLKKGIKAPLSGSAATNGIELAEQIGGQIFSDCWGYVAYDDADLAKELAQKMSSVTHDKDGIEGGIFVAVCISLAYRIQNTREIIEKGLEYLDAKSNYVALCKEVIRQHDCYPEDAEKVLQWIQKNHGYDKYPGVCHILPNTAIMIWAMLYGNNEFDKTMNMLCEAGWDTDCTLGNVGSIMGAMLGIEGIDRKWIDPINDILLSSSCVGSENIDTVSSSVRVFTELGWKLRGFEVPEKFKRNRHKVDFLLPYATSGLTVNKHRYFESNLLQVEDKLKVAVNNAYPHAVGKISLKTYYRADEVYDARYEPSLSPLVYPNETVSVTLANPEKFDAKFCVYALASDGSVWRSDIKEVSQEATTLSLKLPEGDYTVLEYGLEVYPQSRQMKTYFWIIELVQDGNYQYSMDFTKLPMEDWGYDFGGNRRQEVMGCVTHHGNAYCDEEGLHLNGLLTFGDASSAVTEMEVDFKKADEDELQLIFDYQGFMNYKSISIQNNLITYQFKQDDEVKCSENWCEKNLKDKLSLKIDRKHGLIKVVFESVIIEITEPTLIDGYGAMGLWSENSKNCIIYGCKLEKSNFQ